MTRSPAELLSETYEPERQRKFREAMRERAKKTKTIPSCSECGSQLLPEGQELQDLARTIKRLLGLQAKQCSTPLERAMIDMVEIYADSILAPPQEEDVP